MQDPELAQKAIEYAEKLEGIAPEVWRILVRQQYVESVSWLVVGVFALAITYLLRPRHTDARHFVALWSGPGDGFPHFLVFTIALTSVVVCVVGFLTGGLQQLINPEYYALMDLIPGK